MSRVVYFDCASGASGDMLLGALVDLGLPLETLAAELHKLPLRGYRLAARKVDRSGLQATQVGVRVETGSHDHGDPHRHAPHDGHGPAHAPGAGHEERGLREILALLDASSLSVAVRGRCAQLFRRLAEAEGAVHGVRPEDVHFHEVGAVDSIVDVVGAVCGLTWLGAERFVASPMNVGSGSVTMSHGTYPVPPPATAALVRGAPIFGAGEGELLTPTGALLVTSFASSYGSLPPMRLEAVGHGAGARDTPGRPNVLRLLVGEEEAGIGAGERVSVIECEVDDMSPQLLGALMDKLFARGALDVYYTPVQMKKGRPGVLITVLSEPPSREALSEVLFTESTTLGIRLRDCARDVLAREVVQVQTAYGPVGVKVGRRGGRIYNAQPEFDDCQRAAEVHGVAVKEVWGSALAAWRQAGR